MKRDNWYTAFSSFSASFHSWIQSRYFSIRILIVCTEMDFWTNMKTFRNWKVLLSLHSNNWSMRKLFEKRPFVREIWIVHKRVVTDLHKIAVSDWILIVSLFPSTTGLEKARQWNCIRSVINKLCLCFGYMHLSTVIFLLQVYAVFSICLRLNMHIIVIKGGFLKILKINFNYNS